MSYFFIILLNIIHAMLFFKVFNSLLIDSYLLLVKSIPLILISIYLKVLLRDPYLININTFSQFSVLVEIFIVFSLSYSCLI